MTDHIVDPSTILVGSSVTFTCPSCDFTERHIWLPGDGKAFGDSFCFAHDPRVEMVITEVIAPTE